MEDLISRQAAIDECNKEGAHGYISAYELSILPSAQPDIVRCKDCEFWGTHFRTVGGKYGDCLNLERGTRADFYCGWGSRKDETN